MLALDLQPTVEEAESKVVRSITDDDIQTKYNALWSAPTAETMEDDVRNKAEADLTTSLLELKNTTQLGVKSAHFGNEPKDNKNTRSAIRKLNKKIDFLATEVQGIKGELKQSNESREEIKHLMEDFASLREVTSKRDDINTKHVREIALLHLTYLLIAHVKEN